MTDIQTYGSSGKLRSWIPVFVVLGAIPVMVLLLHQLPNEKSNAIGLAAWGIMIGVGVLAAVVAMVVAHRLAKRAARRLGEILQLEGFTFVPEATEVQRDAVMEGMSPLALFESAGTLHWHAWKKVNGETLPAVVLQHSHVQGSGKYAREHFRTLVAWPVQQVKPEMWMRRPKAGINKITGTADVPDVLVGDAVFDKAFLIQSPGDATAPQRLLTDSIRSFILVGPKRESWVLARGYACCIFHADVAPDGLRVMLRRAREMARMWKAS